MPFSTIGGRPLYVLAMAIVGAAALLTACSSEVDPDSMADARSELDELVAFATQAWPTNWTESRIDLSELILGVGATEPRDAIPPIDDPVFESTASASTWLARREPGALVRLAGDARFFPLSILSRHEIVNDEIGGVPVAVTYCPLCNTALTFDRRVNGQVLRFGVSGLLRNSDLVMWDDQTVSLWQQITGEGIVGDLAGTKLTAVSTSIVSFGDFADGFPDGRSLSRDTGYPLTYGTTPYAGYSDRITPIFPTSQDRDDRYRALERVVGVSVDTGDKAYPFSVLRPVRVVNDFVGDVPVVVWWGSPDTADALDAPVIADADAIGTAIAFNPVVRGQRLTFVPDGDRFRDNETGTSWSILGQAVAGPLAGAELETVNHRNEFWFAWTAFFPDAEVYGG